MLMLKFKMIKIKGKMINIKGNMINIKGKMSMLKGLSLSPQYQERSKSGVHGWPYGL